MVSYVVQYTTCKENFKVCRHVIDFDGSFLKGPCGGKILADIGRDPNHQMFPIEFVIVEGKTKNIWTWLLNF